MIRLSKRLMTVASLISDGYVLADVGTDHGYVPIYLMQQKRIPRAIAMDIRKGPLQRAEEHILLYGMGEYITTRLSDGVTALVPGEADTVLIAGMGGGLVIHILEAGQTVCRGAKELVLQPQSELERVRSYLDANGYRTDAEEMVEEDGKYYPMMRVHYEPLWKRTGEEARLFHIYGEFLLKRRHPELLAYLKKERAVYQSLEAELKSRELSPKAGQRLLEVKKILEWNEAALSYDRQGEGQEEND